MPKCKYEGCNERVDTFYYCDDHFLEEEGEPCDECGAIHDKEDKAMTIKEVGEPIYIGRGKA